MHLNLDAIFDPDRLPGEPVSSLPDVIPTSSSDLSADWHFEWDERAAIMEYEGGLPRERAEALALADVLARMQGLPRPKSVEGTP